MFSQIPLEMRQYNQWVCWRYEDMQDGKPTKIPYCPQTGRKAKVDDSSTWASFEAAVAVAHEYSGIGFVLSDNDPYTFIDLDDPYECAPNGKPKHANPQEVLDRQINVFNKFDSYSERSPSGKGLHIIVKASVDSGRKRSAIEVYSSLRYMTMTGNVYKNAPIVERQALINILWEQLGKGASVYTNQYNGPEVNTDEEIIEMASNAANGQKFMDLFKGHWQNYYDDDISKESCNEADFALVDMIAFYTQNRFQITRIFRNSALGQRKKAYRADYMEYMLNRCFDRMLPPVDIEGLRVALETAISENCLKNRRSNFDSDGTLQAGPTLTLPQNPAIEPKAPLNSIYNVPPGLMGLIAQFIYQQAPRPVPEIALAGAIGFMAGICGRSYNISGTGLNQYVLLLANTGTGKEAIAKGISKLIGTVQRTVPAANEFVGPTGIASPQALIKYLSKDSVSFVSLVGEFGKRLQEMTMAKTDKNEIGIMKLLLDIYNKSGEGDVLGGSIYSDREKNVSSIQAPAFSLMGESAPESFYKVLSESIIEDGLLPRFTIIEYLGLRPAYNKEHKRAQPSFDLIEQLATLCAHSLMLNNAHKAVHVEMDAQSEAYFDKYDKFCDQQINSATNETTRHLWNRGHIKAMKLAALVAVGQNPYNPYITAPVANWALQIIDAGIRNLLTKFESGDIGKDVSESKQTTHVCKVFRDYVTADWKKIEKYKSSKEKLHADKLVTLAYINKRLSSVSAFREDRLGATKAIHRAIENLKSQGDIREVGAKQLADDYGYSGKVYAIVNLAQFGLEKGE